MTLSSMRIAAFPLAIKPASNELNSGLNKHSVAGLLRSSFRIHSGKNRECT